MENQYYTLRYFILNGDRKYELQILHATLRLIKFRNHQIYSPARVTVGLATRRSYGYADCSQSATL